MQSKMGKLVALQGTSDQQEERPQPRGILPNHENIDLEYESSGASQF